MATTVRLVGAKDTNADMKLAVGKTTLGRNVKDLQCPDKKVSREHAVIEVGSDGVVSLTATHVNPCFIYEDGEEEMITLKKGETKVLKDGDKFSLLPQSYIYKVVVGATNNSSSQITSTTKLEKATDSKEKTKETVVRKDGKKDAKKDKKPSKKVAKADKSDDEEEYEESGDDESEEEEEEEEEEENPSDESEASEDEESDYDDRKRSKRGSTVKVGSAKKGSSRGRPARKAVKPPVKENIINDGDEDEDFPSDDPEDDDDDFEPSSESDWEEERRGKKGKKRKQESDEDASDEDWGSRKKKSSATKSKKSTLR